MRSGSCEHKILCASCEPKTIVFGPYEPKPMYLATVHREKGSLAPRNPPKLYSQLWAGKKSILTPVEPEKSTLAHAQQKGALALVNLAFVNPRRIVSGCLCLASAKIDYPWLL